MYPDMWCEVITSSLHKLDQRVKPITRGISLLFTLGKVFSKILNSRKMSWATSQQKLYLIQGTYQKDKSTIGDIFTLMAVGQRYLRRADGWFYCVFIDFRKCFDSKPHILNGTDFYQSKYSRQDFKGVSISV